MRVVGERGAGALELAVALDVDLVERVDHHFCHGVVAQERLQRPVAEDVVGDVADDLAGAPPASAASGRASTAR